MNRQTRAERRPDLTYLPPRFTDVRSSQTQEMLRRKTLTQNKPAKSSTWRGRHHGQGVPCYVDSFTCHRQPMARATCHDVQHCWAGPRKAT